MVERKWTNSIFESDKIRFIFHILDDHNSITSSTDLVLSKIKNWKNETGNWNFKSNLVGDIWANVIKWWRQLNGSGVNSSDFRYHD